MFKFNKKQTPKTNSTSFEVEPKVIITDKRIKELYGVSYYNSFCITGGANNKVLSQSFNDYKTYDFVTNKFSIFNVLSSLWDKNNKKIIKDIICFKTKIKRIPYDLNKLYESQESEDKGNILYIIDYKQEGVQTIGHNENFISQYSTISQTRDEVNEIIAKIKYSQGYDIEVFTTEIVEEKIDLNDVIKTKFNIK